MARRNSTNAQHSPHFDSLISHCEKYSKSLLVSGKSQKETARHTSTLPYKEEEIFGEFHTSFAFLFHSFHFKWQATLVVLCHVRLQHQFDSYFVSFLCVYICILWGPLRILSWACCVYSPSSVAGTQYLGCRVDYSLAPPSSTISPVMNRRDYQLLPLLLPPPSPSQQYQHRLILAIFIINNQLSRLGKEIILLALVSPLFAASSIFHYPFLLKSRLSLFCCYLQDPC